MMAKTRLERWMVKTRLEMEGLQAEECGQPLDTGKGKERDIPLRASRRSTAQLTPWFSQVICFWPQNHRITNVFKPPSLWCCV